MNLFKKEAASYDFHYLKEEDLSKPQVPKMYSQIPQLRNDPVLISGMFAVDPEAPPEVAEYFKQRSVKAAQKEKEKYAEALAIMKDVSYFTREENNNIIIYDANNQNNPTTDI